MRTIPLILLGISTFCLAFAPNPLLADDREWDAPGQEVIISDPSSLRIERGEDDREWAGQDTTIADAGAPVPDRTFRYCAGTRCKEDGRGAPCDGASECSASWNTRCNEDIEDPACVGASEGGGHGCAVDNDCLELRCDKKTLTCRPGGDGPLCTPHTEGEPVTAGQSCFPEGAHHFCDSISNSCVDGRTTRHDTWVRCTPGGNECRRANRKVCRGGASPVCAPPEEGDHGNYSACSDDADCTMQFCDQARCVRGLPADEATWDWARRCSTDEDCAARACRGNSHFSQCLAGMNGPPCSESTCQVKKCGPGDVCLLINEKRPSERPQCSIVGESCSRPTPAPTPPTAE